jgi:His/Glu/Gln/Arg/opine family amino acid ABC transporter permease subunit
VGRHARNDGPVTWKPEAVTGHLPFLLAGAQTTVLVTVAAMAVALVVGAIVALARLSRWRVLQFASGLYIDIARSTPLLAQLIWTFYALPILIGYALEPFAAGVLTLAFHDGAYLAEIYRAGILSIPTGQRYAALSLGMTPAQALWRVVLPQAVTRMLPPIGSQFIILFKESALVSLITLQELMWQAQSLAAFTMRPFEVLTAAALIYMALTLPQSVLVNYLHRRYLAH